MNPYQAGASVVGTGLQIFAAFGSYRENKRIARASQEAERLRRIQAELDNRRRMTQLIREANANRARAIAVGAQSGSLNSSSVQGGLASILSQGGANVFAQAQNANIGFQIFDQNATISRSRARQQDYQAIGQIGASLSGNAQQIGSIGQTLFEGNTQPAPVTTPWETTIESVG